MATPSFAAMFRQRWPPILREDQVSFPALTSGGFSNGSLVDSFQHSLLGFFPNFDLPP
jgi:hypothetical protein